MHNTQINSSHLFLNSAVIVVGGVVAEEVAASPPLGVTAAGADADSSCLHLEEHPAAAVVVALRQLLRCQLP
jgi:hypothetical protein